MTHVGSQRDKAPPDGPTSISHFTISSNAVTVCCLVNVLTGRGPDASFRKSAAPPFVLVDLTEEKLPVVAREQSPASAR